MKTDDKLIFEQYHTVTENSRQNPVVNKDGDKFWYNELGELHREDGPAYEGANGTEEWWVNGELHREDGPAFEGANGTKWWCVNNKCYSTTPEWTRTLFLYKGHTPEKLGQERFNDLVRAFTQKIEDMYENR